MRQSLSAYFRPRWKSLNACRKPQGRLSDFESKSWRVGASGLQRLVYWTTMARSINYGWSMASPRIQTTRSNCDRLADALLRLDQVFGGPCPRQSGQSFQRRDALAVWLSGGPALGAQMDDFIALNKAAERLHLAAAAMSLFGQRQGIRQPDPAQNCDEHTLWTKRCRPAEPRGVIRPSTGVRFSAIRLMGGGGRCGPTTERRGWHCAYFSWGDSHGRAPRLPGDIGAGDRGRTFSRDGNASFAAFRRRSRTRRRCCFERPGRASREYRHITSGRP